MKDKISFWKTQWFNLAMAVGALVAIIVNLVQDDKLMVVAWSITCIYWILMSFIDSNSEKIRMLEAKAKKYDALVEKVDALQELLETEIKYNEQWERRVNLKLEALRYEVEGK